MNRSFEEILREYREGVLAYLAERLGRALSREERAAIEAVHSMMMLESIERAASVAAPSEIERMLSEFAEKPRPQE
jgi:hypothetical protein